MMNRKRRSQEKGSKVKEQFAFISISIFHLRPILLLHLTKRLASLILLELEKDETLLCEI